ncbi:AMP-binding enzyme [Marinobacter subterrani]|uniref:AMP-binding enzyme n=1 Tax=Marinobacter subterrani TaxID=1658765 RepID=UPI0023549F71|nr:hypothetical protein [Marinobacter subterrani]
MGVADDMKGEVPMCFVVLHPAAEAERETIEATLKALVGEKFGKAFAPKAIFVVDALPRTKNGKLLRRVIKNAFLGNDIGDLSALDNFAAVEQISELGPRDSIQ